VVDDFADGVEAAGSGAGVVALVVPATGEGSVTVGVDDTLRATSGVRVSEVLWSAGALTAGPADSGVRIGTTGVRVAGVPWWWRDWGGKY
jgi:hypothetical protein